MLLHFDGTLIVIAISFIIFAIIMHKIFYLPMRRVIEERKEYIQLHIEEAKNLDSNANEAIGQYNAKINAARLTGQAAIDESTESSKSKKSKVVSEASGKAFDEIRVAKEALQKEKDEAFSQIKDEVAPLAQQIVSKILGTTVSISGIDNDKVDKILRG
ncbi:MAG: ATP synthase F0 subunit B [Vampirovibrionia bacterium]